MTSFSMRIKERNRANSVVFEDHKIVVCGSLAQGKDGQGAY
jgi:hypothetical protein